MFVFITYAFKDTGSGLISLIHVRTESQTRRQPTRIRNFVTETKSITFSSNDDEFFVISNQVDFRITYDFKLCAELLDIVSSPERRYNFPKNILLLIIFIRSSPKYKSTCATLSLWRVFTGSCCFYTLYNVSRLGINEFKS